MRMRIIIQQQLFPPQNMVRPPFETNKCFQQLAATAATTASAESAAATAAAAKQEYYNYAPTIIASEPHSTPSLHKSKDSRYQPQPQPPPNPPNPPPPQQQQINKIRIMHQQPLSLPPKPILHPPFILSLHNMTALKKGYCDNLYIALLKNIN